MEKLSEINNYEKLKNGIIRQINIKKREYNFEYSNIYNSYGEKSNYLSYLRLGILLGTLNNIPNSILDVGYGNGAFLNCSNNVIKNCYGYDISDYPIPTCAHKVTDIFDKHFEVICFFDSLEHFDDINIIDKLKCEYIFISVPWCHYNSDEWFLNWHHRRPNEHLWHFNDESLVRFFHENGYEKLYLGNFEDTIRKNASTDQPNILSAIFKKKANLQITDRK
jgi:hypothetical protein